MDASKPPVIVVDGSYLLHRTYHAVPPMYTDDGILVNAAFGTIKHIIGLYNRYNPTHMAVVIDRPEPTFRHKLSPLYKAHRAPYPDEFTNQIEWVIKLLNALSIPVVSIPGYEGDDMVGTLAQIASDAGEEVLIITADKDMAQLVTQSVKLYDSFNRRLMDIEAVYQKFGVYPDNIANLLALTGDKADGIAGVIGVGPTTASNLLAEYGNLTGVLANIDDIKGTLALRLRSSLESIKVDRELTGIVIDLDLKLTFDDLLLGETNMDQLDELYDRLNFNTFL